MKPFLMIIFVLQSFNLVAQTNERFLHQYKKDKSILLYSYIQRNDSSFIYGHVVEKKTNNPVLNINILVKDFTIGTVPRRDGNFTLFLPRQQGTIVFDKPGFTYFEFPFKFKKEKLQRSSAHH